MAETGVRVEAKKKKLKLATVLFFTIMFIIMAQNYFLVKKNENLIKIIEQHLREMSRGNTMQYKDSMQAFGALTLDSVFTIVNPHGNKKKLFFVFTTWCGACVQNVSEWNKLAKQLGNNELMILGISPDSLYKIREFKSKVKPDFPIMSVAGDTLFMKKYKLFNIPQTLLIDSEGLVVKVWPGLLTGEDQSEIIHTTR